MDPDWFRDPPTLYYHPDHLGSTSFASNNEQTLTQRDEYFPSGELWIDASDSRYELRRAYVFTGKELDQATGLYYFGARYYDPRSSVWLSPDPILDEYMEGGTSGGVFNPGNLGLYSYTLNNPVNLVDPDGRSAQGAHRNFPPGANGCRHPSCFNGPAGQKYHQEQMLQRMNAGAAAAGRTSRGIGDGMRRLLFRFVMQQQQAARPPAQPAAAPTQPPPAAQPAKGPQPAPAAKPPQGADAAKAPVKQTAPSKEAAGIDRARAARDAAGRRPDGKPDRTSAAYVGITRDGKVEVGRSGPRLHAEVDAEAKLPGGTMTEVNGWRRNQSTGQLEWTEIPVCVPCQQKFPPERFVPGTLRDPPGGTSGSK
jgi:RHS repeat-associated protein